MSEPGAWQSLSGERYIVLETYRKNGVGVRTTVWFVQDNGAVYSRTATKSGKMKRLRNNGKLRLAASNGRDTPKGPWLDVHYDTVAQDDRAEIADQMRKKYGFQWRAVGLLHRLQGNPDYTFLAMRPSGQ